MLIGPQNSANSPRILPHVTAQVRASIAAAATAAGRNEDCVTLLAVSKGQQCRPRCATLAQLGVEHFGENYLQEALPKLDALAGHGTHLAFHRPAAGQQDPRRGRALRLGARRRSPAHRRATRRAAARAGARRSTSASRSSWPTSTPRSGVGAARGARRWPRPSRALPRLRLRGLMCMLPEGLDPARQRERFRRSARAVRAAQSRRRRARHAVDGHERRLRRPPLPPAPRMVRIGTALFGARTHAQTRHAATMNAGHQVAFLGGGNMARGADPGPAAPGVAASQLRVGEPFATQRARAAGATSGCGRWRTIAVAVRGADHGGAGGQAAAGPARAAELCPALASAPIAAAVDRRRHCASPIWPRAVRICPSCARCPTARRWSARAPPRCMRGPRSTARRARSPKKCARRSGAPSGCDARPTSTS